MGSSRRSIISSSIGDSPRIDRAISFPILADVAERIPAIRSRSRSPIRPNSSTIDQSNPLAWPADLSADRNSATLPPGPRISPGAGVRRKSSPSRLLASAIARHWPNSSPAFARVTETHPSRCPGRRSGPTSSPKTNNDSPAVLAFFRAVHSSASFTSGCRASARNPLTYSGITIGWPASGCPGGTISRFAHHAASRSAASTGRTSGGVSGGVNAAARFSSRRRSLKRRWRSRLLTAAAVGCLYGMALLRFGGVLRRSEKEDNHPDIAPHFSSSSRGPLAMVVLILMLHYDSGAARP